MGGGVEILVSPNHVLKRSGSPEHTTCTILHAHAGFRHTSYKLFQPGMKISTASAGPLMPYSLFPKLETPPNFDYRCEFSSAKNHEPFQDFVFIANHCNKPDKHYQG